MPFSLIGPEMELRDKGEKLGKLALIDQILICTDCAKIEAWLPVLVAAEAVDKNCIIVCDPAIVHLNIVSLLPPSEIYSYWDPVLSQGFHFFLYFSPSPVSTRSLFFANSLLNAIPPAWLILHLHLTI